MQDLVRFGISMSKDLLEQFDGAIARKGYTNRSEAIRDLARYLLLEENWEQEDQPVTGAVTLVYHHHDVQATRAVTRYQHDNSDIVVSTLHVHLDHDRCLEVVVLRGPARKVKELANNLASLKGVQHGKVVMAAASQRLP